ncbi:MAG: hypothetical protein J3Q66DRAFT_353783 [Benniella sp.]|nr:MAG: hypothetical protein J3Q66DRAFT_353783 [Benniella sp.]
MIAHSATLSLILALALVIIGPMANAAPLPELSSLPACAINCALGSIDPISCSEFINTIAPCVQQACNGQVLPIDLTRALCIAP